MASRLRISSCWRRSSHPTPFLAHPLQNQPMRLGQVLRHSLGRKPAGLGSLANAPRALIVLDYDGTQADG